MGCTPSCSIPCCCSCCDIKCCSCCPCFQCCGCWCRGRRCHCRCDPFRKYAENDVCPAPVDESASVPATENSQTQASTKTDGGNIEVNETPENEGLGLFAMVVRPSSQISQSTGMELQVSDTSRSPSMLSDGPLSDVTESDVEMKNGVCIDGKFYPRPKSAKHGRRDRGRECNFSVSNIISVSIADKASTSARLIEGESMKPKSPESNESQAPRRLAKIDIKEERRKMMSELSQFKRKKSKRRKKKSDKASEYNSAFEDCTPNNKDGNKETTEGEDAGSEPSLRISSASDTDFYDIDRIRTVRVRGSPTGSSSGTDSNILNIIKESQEGPPEYQYSDEAINSHNKSPRGLSSPSKLSSSSPLDSEVETNSSETTGQITNISQTALSQSVTADSRTAANHSQQKESKADSLALNALAKSRYGLGPRQKDFPPKAHRTTNGSSILFPSAALSTKASSKPGDRVIRGLSMSRHFQGQAQQVSTATSSASNSLAKTSNKGNPSKNQARPMSAVMRHITGGTPSMASSSSPMSRYDSMWTLAGDAATDVEGSMVNSDQESVTSTSSTGRPASNYGIRTHSEAVYSLQRWRNMKVNPF